LEGQKRWLSTQPDHSPPAHLAAQVIHGDYHDANVLFTGDRLVGVLDWEKAGGGDPAAEVVRAVHLSFDLAPKQTSAFVSGYRSRRELSDTELDDGAFRYGYGRDRSVWLFKELYLQGNERLRALVNPRPFQPFSALWKDLRF
jgi:aminoglycoside phosphotransferase (APT) family kinase protein